MWLHEKDLYNLVSGIQIKLSISMRTLHYLYNELEVNMKKVILFDIPLEFGIGFWEISLDFYVSKGSRHPVRRIGICKVFR